MGVMGAEKDGKYFRREVDTSNRAKIKRDFG